MTNGATVMQSRYNALGQRVEKSNGDVFVYDEKGHLIGEYSKGTGRMQREIVYLGDEPVALLTQTSPARHRVRSLRLTCSTSTATTWARRA